MMEKALLSIPILGELYRLLESGSLLTQIGVALFLYFVVPLGGYLLLFWLIHKVRRYCIG